ncbi:MAG: 50S ribosomal protein L11 methyltransferase [Lachnospiraceae bacterium]|nr:50S ribosomal protein L11 methyltransferase [Lachnospiraceae bacterium]
MKWEKYSIATTTAAEEEICALLSDLGIDAVEIEDFQPVEEMTEKEGGYFEELQPDLPEDDGTARVIFYLEEGNDANAGILERLRHGLEDKKKDHDIGSGEIAVSVSDEMDWRDNWKAFFHAFSIGDLLIKPTWESVPVDAKAQTVLEIDPGISFGTGQHETTRMCIEELQRHLMQGDTVLDVGFGSGILSIAALKLGAGKVTGTDIDEDCLGSVASNLRINGLDPSAGSFYIGNLATDTALQETVGRGCYDIVLANILADIILQMRARIYDALKPGGILIASGIIDFKENEVLSSLTENGFSIIETNHLGEWAEITAKKEPIMSMNAKHEWQQNRASE